MAELLAEGEDMADILAEGDEMADILAEGEDVADLLAEGDDVAEPLADCEVIVLFTGLNCNKSGHSRPPCLAACVITPVR